MVPPMYRGYFVNISAPSLALLIIGFLLLYAPTYIDLNNEVWNQDGQGHGPIILGLSAWLLWRKIPALGAASFKPAPVAGWITCLIGFFFYAIGRSQDFSEFEAGSQMFVLAGLFLLFGGWARLRLVWFPIVFLIFMVPLPGVVVQALTGPLKMGVSYVVENLLYALDYPIARSGVTLTIGQYELLVADACAGLNSMFALESLGIFYMNVQGYTSKLRNMLLALFLIPVAFLANVVRVVVLVLVTYYFGDEAGQGFVHGFAGMLLFMVAAMLMIGLDGILSFFFKAKPSVEAQKRAA